MEDKTNSDLQKQEPTREAEHTKELQKPSQNSGDKDFYWYVEKAHKERLKKYVEKTNKP